MYTHDCYYQEHTESSHNIEIWLATIHYCEKEKETYSSKKVLHFSSDVLDLDQEVANYWHTEYLKLLRGRLSGKI